MGLEETEKLAVLPEDIKDKDKEIEELKAKIKELEEHNLEKLPCVRCGREDREAPIKLDEKLIKSYFISILGQKPFRHTIKCYDGLISFTFSELSGQALINQDTYLRTADSESTYMSMLETISLVSCLSEVVIEDKESFTVNTIYKQTDEELAENAKNPQAARDKLMVALGQMKLGLARKAHTVFLTVMTGLMDKVQDQSFYEGAGLL